MEVHGVSEKNLLKLVMKKRCAHTDKNLKLLIRIHMPSAGHNVEIVSSSRKDAKSGGELARAFCQSEGGRGPGNAAIRLTTSRPVLSRDDMTLTKYQ